MITEFLRGLRYRENQRAFAVGGGIGLVSLAIFTVLANWPH